VYEAVDEEENMWTLENLYHIRYYEEWIMSSVEYNQTCEWDFTGENQCSGNSFISLI
jgi:hypothetical protein